MSKDGPQENEMDKSKDDDDVNVQAGRMVAL
jgi:hypothetical protein